MVDVIGRNRYLRFYDILKNESSLGTELNDVPLPALQQLCLYEARQYLLIGYFQLPVEFDASNSLIKIKKWGNSSSTSKKITTGYFRRISIKRNKHFISGPCLL